MSNKFLYSVILLSSIVLAQQQPPPPFPANNAPPPVLDELNSTKLKLISTQQALYRTQLDEVQKAMSDSSLDLQKLVIEIEAKYPNYTVNLQTGTLIAKPQQPTIKSKEDQIKEMEKKYGPLKDGTNGTNVKSDEGVHNKPNPK